MSRLVGQLRQAWDGRTRREQRLLAAMVLLLAAVAIWLGVVRPVTGWREAAARERDRAAVELVETRLAAVRLAPAAEAAPRTDAGGLEPVVRQTAEAVGLDIAIGMDPAGRLGFDAPRAPAGAVFGWLAALETTHGLRPVSLSVVENADASLQVQGAF